MNEWLIRKAELCDIKALTELRIVLLSAAGDVKSENMSKVFHANLHYFKKKLANGSFSAWIADVDGKMVAMSGLVFFERPPQGENISGLEAYIMNMYTIPEYRGQGIARSLPENVFQIIAA